MLKSYRHLLVEQVKEFPYKIDAVKQDARYDRLLRSIQASGILVPIAVVQHDPQILVFDGFRRLAAAWELRFERIPAIVHELREDVDIFQKQLEMNPHASQRGGEMYVRRIIMARPRMRLKELMMRVHLSETSIMGLSIFKTLLPSMLESIRDNQFPISYGVAMNKLAGLNEEVATQLLERAVIEKMPAELLDYEAGQLCRKFRKEAKS